MIDPKKLLSDLQRLLKKLEEDLRKRCLEQADVGAKVRAQYSAAKDAGRTAQSYEVWRDEFITQAAVAWILGCVFVRFLEDNNLIETPHLSGPKDRTTLARDRHILYFRQHSTHSDREYLEYVFRDVATLPAMRELFDERHNPLWTLGLTGDGATLLLNFFQQVDPATGVLVHDFTDEEWNTRFLGDLYQDLSEAARKKYALLQTPNFVEEFILDRTLTPAIGEFGYQAIRLIDPACGSGHFLLGAFYRLFDLSLKNEPGANPRVLAQQALSSVHGVDLNPYAVAIARFRLLLAALNVSVVARLKDAPDFKINLAVGDSLLHGEHKQEQTRMGWHPIAHVYETEDKETLDRILKRAHYHAVVGNPPYITVKDSALSKAYRERLGSCHRRYSLAVPFIERCLDLTIQGNGNTQMAAGFVGMITANSFIKQQFGKKLIESYIPRWDLTHVIDTSGAYIPGHGTPTVIVFARNRKPLTETIRVVMGIRGEPSTPEDAAKGQVWTAIVNQVDDVGSQSDFVSVADTARSSFHKHPWSIGGGGAAELKELLDEQSEKTVGQVAISVGPASFPGLDDAFVASKPSLIRAGIPSEYIKKFIYGEIVRDWRSDNEIFAFAPYNRVFQLIPLDEKAAWAKWLWSNRTSLANIVSFGGKTRQELGDYWWGWYRWIVERFRTPLSICMSFVATHNHFTLDRGGNVFNRHAPLIKLSPDAQEDDYISLLGVFNSAVACFWMKQVFHNKGAGGGTRVASGHSPLGDEAWESHFEFSGTGLESLPLPQKKHLEPTRSIVRLGKELQLALPAAVAECAVPHRDAWQQSEQRAAKLRSQMIARQEELDWQCYELYGLTSDELTLPIEQVPPIQLGERGFEIVMARRMAGGELETTWFERHGSTPITEIPEHWPIAYRELVARRIALIESDHNIALIEQPEYKRRWKTEPWATQQERALRGWLLNRLEDARSWTELQLVSCARLADRVRQDAEFKQVAEFYRGREDFDLLNLITELVRAEAVPFLPVLRYKESGLRTRALWESTWAKQRAEDAIDARTRLHDGDPQRLTVEQATQLKREQVGDIPVPPKYKSADFQETVCWRLRGKLDVAKERFISYPWCERDADQTMVIAWAGWDHLQQARALAGYYEMVKSSEGWSDARLTPLLAGVLELVPWLLQWHNEIDLALNLKLGDFFKSFVEEEARSMGKTIDEIKAWKPK